MMELNYKQAWLNTIHNGGKLRSYAVFKRDFFLEQGKSEGFDSCDRPSNLTQIGFETSIFQPVWPQNLMDDPEKL